MTEPAGTKPEKKRGFRQRVSVYLASGAIVALFFIADLLLPRGAAPPVGYCAAVVLAGEARRSVFTVVLAAVCSLLTWIAYFLEPEGSPAWMSSLNRGMVMAVIWLTAVLELLRVNSLRALEQRSRELARSNRELEQFASVVSHDLRSPLMSIKGWTRLLERQLGAQLEPKAGEMLQHISTGAETMTELVNRLLEYGRVDAHQLQVAPCDANQVVQNVQITLRSAFEANSASLSHDRLPEVRADETLLTQLVQNLVENALKYRREVPPSVHVSARRGHHEWIFSVRDNGQGIPTEDLERIFELFERGAQRNTDRPGIGIGLGTCKRIIERHGGRIWAESTLGQGSEFFFTIPDSRPASAYLRR